MTEFDMPPASAGFEARGGWLVRRLMADFKLSAAQAGGIVGNLGFESAGFAAYHEIGQPEGVGGYGWAQWTASRRVSFFAWCTAHSLDPRSDEANYGYLASELNGSQAHAIDRLRLTTTLQAAVFTFGFHFEKPGGTTDTFLPGFAGRLGYAQRALSGYASLPQETAPAPVEAPKPVPAPIPAPAPVPAPPVHPAPSWWQSAGNTVRGWFS